MKPANQNVMDVLLRSLARRDRGSMSAQLEAGSHLDADELNAFAEGMVTERARARYSSHLADCDKCRSLIVSLSQSAGRTAPRVTTEDKQAASFWQQLAGFFSHPVLRFVIPAVVLVSIIGIGLIALRQDRPDQFIAQHDPSQEAANAGQVNQGAPTQSSTPTEPGASPAAAVASPTANSSADARRGQNAGSVAGLGASEGPNILRKEADAPPSPTMPTFAPDVAAPAPAPPRAATEQRDQAQTLARPEAVKREDETVRAAEPQTRVSVSVDDRNKAATVGRRAANQPQTGSVEGLMSGERKAEDKDKNKADTSGRGDARTISGKRFVRQNNAWIDSAYQQSRATTNVKRGSEQYRALIADEPGLRSFSEQLGGEVIVVWKGRAYKFY